MHTHFFWECVCSCEKSESETLAKRGDTAATVMALMTIDSFSSGKKNKS